MKRQKRWSWALPILLAATVGCQSAPTSSPAPTLPKTTPLLPQGGEEPVPLAGATPAPVFYPFPIMPSFGGSSIDSKRPDYPDCDNEGQMLWQHDVVPATGKTFGAGVAALSRGAVVFGNVQGSMGADPPTGNPDVFVQRVDAQGNPLWTDQFGAVSLLAQSAASDDHAIYVGGIVVGALPGQTALGNSDAFIRKYGMNGEVLWTRQFGTPLDDQLLDIHLYKGRVYVLGATNGLIGDAQQGGLDAFVRAYDANGNVLWTTQFGSPLTDQGLKLTVDDSGVYVAGATTGSFPGFTNAGNYDLFVQKLDLQGNLVWVQQLGSPQDDVAYAIAKIGNVVYAGGQTQGTLPGQTSQGQSDMFLVRYDEAGNWLTTRQFGTPEADELRDLYTDGRALYAVGNTRGQFFSTPKQGEVDTVVMRMDPLGNIVWGLNFAAKPYSQGVAISGSRSGLYVTGTAYSSPAQTDNLAFLIKLGYCAPKHRD